MGAPSPTARWPVPDWDRYELLGYLGEGGMGRVWHARDPRLGRDVALKFLKSDDPDLVARFAREARAQAKVEHEHVCAVHEVGEVDGHPYIAMQLIDGAPLHIAAAAMTLEQKVLAVRQVAEALHAAHRLGLVHRDVKPANVLVERTEDGGFRPWVLDFGLAREVAAPAETATATILGTPAYAAPEQVLGRRDLDRRTDVYGLGATLYEVLTGAPPFTAPSGVEVLLAVLEEEPLPLRSQLPSLPQDLEAIVLKCLEKSPGDRYESARALADDLDRFLDGSPVLARPRARVVRWLRLARRHRAAAAVAGVAAALLLALGGYTVHARLQSGEREAAAQRLGQVVQEVEGLLRYAEVLPLHDLDPTRAVVRERMDEIRTEIGRRGRVMGGAGHFALGRAHLALGEHEAARRELEAAWQLGHRTPDTAAALGQTLGELYHQELGRLEAIASEELRLRRERELDEGLRRPALRLLRQHATGARVPRAYVEGLIALYDGDLAAALPAARTAAAAGWWEGRLLEGRIHMAAAAAAERRGARERVLEHLERAGDAFAAAAEVARSSRAVYEAQCERWLEEMQQRALRGEPGDEAYRRGLQAVDSAQRTAPGSAAPLIQATHLHLGWSELGVTGEDAAAGLERAVAAARRAIELEPGNPLAHHAVSLALRRQALLEQDRGEDPIPSLRGAVAAIERQVELEGASAAALSNLATIYRAWARTESQREGDASARFELAAAAAERARELAPDLPEVHHNLGRILNDRATYELHEGRDPRPFLARAERCYEVVTARDPDFPPTLNEVGNLHLLRARWEAEQGVDPRATLRRAEAAYRRAIELRPSYSYALKNLGDAHIADAEWVERSGGDPRPSLELALTAYRRARTVQDGYFNALRGEGRALLLLAALSERPRPLLEDAVRALEAGLALRPGDAACGESLAGARRSLAQLGDAPTAARRPAPAARVGRG